MGAGAGAGFKSYSCSQQEGLDERVARALYPLLSGTCCPLCNKF